MPNEFSPPQAAPGAAGLFETPDHTKSKDSVPIPPGVRKAASRLGANKKLRGGPRKLTDDDRQKIIDYYDMLAWALKNYKPAVAEAIKDRSILEFADGEPVYGPARTEICADAWMELAEQNDSVRRVILMLVETGAWSKLFMAHTPILLAALPDDVLSRVMLKFMSFGNDDSDNQDNQDTVVVPGEQAA